MHLLSWRSCLRTLVLFFAILCLGMPSAISAKPAKKNSSQPKETITYVVVKGDSVDKIAKKFEVRSDDIVRWNNLADASKIRIGQKLKIRVVKGSYTRPSSSGGGSVKTRRNYRECLLCREKRGQPRQNCTKNRGHGRTAQKK